MRHGKCATNSAAEPKDILMAKNFSTWLELDWPGIYGVCIAGLRTNKRDDLYPAKLLLFHRQKADDINSWSRARFKFRV